MLFETTGKKNIQSLINCKSNGIYIYSLFSLGIYTEIEIDSSAKKVYQILTDFENYNQWNPSITNIQGSALVDSTIQAEIHWPGLSKNLYTLRLIDLIPNNLIRWKGQFGFRFLFTGDHSFIIQQTHNLSKIQLKQVELFTGLFVPFLYPFLKGNVYQGFILLNQALKEHLEK